MVEPTPNDWAELATRIRVARERLGWSQSDLAAASGLSARTVHSYETGRPPARMPRGLVHVEDALGWRPGTMRAILMGRRPDTAAEPPLVRMTRAEREKCRAFIEQAPISLAVRQVLFRALENVPRA